MVLRLRQHNIGYTAKGFYRSDDPTNSVKALKEVVSHRDRSQSNQAHLTVLQQYNMHAHGIRTMERFTNKSNLT